MQANSHADHRKLKRQTVAVPVSIVRKANELTPDITAATMNISLSGVSILTQVALVPGQEVKIVIKGQFSQTIPTRVVWVREDGSSRRTIAWLKFLAYPIATDA